MFAQIFLHYINCVSGVFILIVVYDLISHQMDIELSCQLLLCHSVNSFGVVFCSEEVAKFGRLHSGPPSSPMGSYLVTTYPWL